MLRNLASACVPPKFDVDDDEEEAVPASQSEEESVPEISSLALKDFTSAEVVDVLTRLVAVILEVGLDEVGGRG